MSRSWLVWAALLGPLVLLVAAGCTRRVRRNELLLVVRRGRVVRSHRHGVALRRPLVERFESLPSGPQVVPLVVRSRTRDEVDIVVLAELTVEVAEVPEGTDLSSAWHPAWLVEDALAALVAAGGWTSVVSHLDEVAGRWPADAPELPPGTSTTGLVVSSVEARLTPGDLP